MAEDGRNHSFNFIGHHLVPTSLPSELVAVKDNFLARLENDASLLFGKAAEPHNDVFDHASLLL
jgi:hypothetical protein